MSDYEAPGGDVVEVIGVEDLLTSPGTSYWLRDAINSSMKRDPVDALSDAEVFLTCSAGDFPLSSSSP